MKYDLQEGDLTFRHMAAEADETEEPMLDFYLILYLRKLQRCWEKK